MNHSYDANTKLDFRPDAETSRYIAIKEISKDDEVTFNYNATEWESEGFECLCCAKNCCKQVRGLKHLPPEEQEKLKPQLLPYLLLKSGL